MFLDQSFGNSSMDQHATVEENGNGEDNGEEWIDMKNAKDPEGEISPQHHKLAMRNVDDPYHSPDKREAHSHQGVDRAEHQPPDEDFDKIDHINPSMIGVMEEWNDGILRESMTKVS